MSVHNTTEPEETGTYQFVHGTGEGEAPTPMTALATLGGDPYLDPGVFPPGTANSTATPHPEPGPAGPKPPFILVDGCDDG